MGDPVSSPSSSSSFESPHTFYSLKQTLSAWTPRRRLIRLLALLSVTVMFLLWTSMFFVHNTNAITHQKVEYSSSMDEDQQHYTFENQTQQNNNNNNTTSFPIREKKVFEWPQFTTWKHQGNINFLFCFLFLRKGESLEKKFYAI